MKIAILAGVAATALIGGAAFAQQPSTPPAPAPEAAAPAAPTGNATSTSVTTADPNGGTVTMTTLTNGPIPDTPANRAKYGQPMSNAGKRTAARGN